MDKQFGGARPKLGTFRRDQQNPVTDGNPIATQESTENEATANATNEEQNTSSSITKKDAPGDLFFKEDHFHNEGCDVTPESNSQKNCGEGTTYKDRQFVGEYLPLTNKLINNAIRGTYLNAPSLSKEQKSVCCSDKYMNQFEGNDVCEPRKKEPSARDRWKKSGIALRNYLLSRFGYRADKEDKVKSCLSCVTNMNTAQSTAVKQSEHYLDDRRHCCESQTSQRSLDSDYPGIPVHKKSDRQENTSSNYDRKLSKIQKGKINNCQRRGVDEKENSNMTHSPEPSPCNSVPETDSRSLNSNWTITSNLTNGKPCICDCRPAVNISSTRKCSCDWSLESRDQKKKSSHKDKSFFSKVQKESSVKLNGKLAKKKPWVGVLDHALSSSTDTDYDESKSSASCAKRRRRKSNSRNSTRSYDRDNETEADSPVQSFIPAGNPEGKVQNDLHSEEPGQKSLCNQQKDILFGLKYALPYLPEKLRRRLSATPAEQDKKQSGSEIESSTASKSYTGNKSVFSVDDFDKKTNVLKERRANTYGKVCDTDSNAKPGFSINSDKCKGKKTVGNSDTGDEDLSPRTLKMGDGDVKFHLNDSGTWTITNFDKDSETDEENTHQGHPHRFKSPFTGQWADMARYEQAYWLDDEIIQLEASIEDPFNVRGDNLIVNDSSPNMTKFDEDSGSELEDKSEGHPYRFRPPFTGHLADSNWLDHEVLEPEASLEDPINIRIDKHILNNSLPRRMNSSLKNHEEIGCEDILTNGHGQCSGSMHLLETTDEQYVNIETDKYKPFNNKLSDGSARNTQDNSKTQTYGHLCNLYDSSFIFSDSDIHSSAVSDVLTSQTGVAQHQSPSPFSSNKKQDDGSERKRDNSIDHSCNHGSSFLIGGNYSSRQIEDSEMKGDNSVDDLCSGLSKIPLSADNLGSYAVTHSSTLDDLNTSRSWKTFSQESDLDADDEFECDCEYCIRIRQQSINQSSDRDIDVATRNGLPVISDESDGHFDNNRSEYVSMPGSDLDIGVSDLMSLDLVVTGTSGDVGLGVMLENVILQLLMDNVIMQMVNVRPDLMSDPAPPPATESVIDNIPTVCLSEKDIDQNPVCPICLCPSALGETMSRLPCQHIFHPLCVQAWLVKSGTCPVCRHRL